MPLREKASKSNLSEHTSLVQRRTEWDADGEEDELKADGKPVVLWAKKCGFEDQKKSLADFAWVLDVGAVLGDGGRGGGGAADDEHAADAETEKYKSFYKTNIDICEIEYFDVHPAAHDPLAPPPLSEHSWRVKQVPFLLPPPAPELEQKQKVISQKKQYYGNFQTIAFILLIPV